MTALINLFNYQGKLHGSTSMGFINPFLYGKGLEFVRDTIQEKVNNCSALFNSHQERTCYAE